MILKTMNIVENKVLSYLSKKLIKNRLYIKPKSTRNALADWHQHIEHF